RLSARLPFIDPRTLLEPSDCGSFHMRLKVWTRAAGLLLLMAWIGGGAGCNASYKARGVVKGQVTLNGKPLTAGTVTFYGDNNRTGSATIDPSGNYTVGDAPVGDCKITVVVPKIGGAGMMGKGGAPKPPAGVGEMRDPNNPSQGGTPQPSLDPSKIVPIPDKY